MPNEFDNYNVSLIGEATQPDDIVYTDGADRVAFSEIISDLATNDPHFQEVLASAVESKETDQTTQPEASTSNDTDNEPKQDTESHRISDFIGKQLGVEYDGQHIRSTHDTVSAFQDLAKTYRAAADHVEINGHIPDGMDVYSKLSEFLHSNVFETIVMRTVDAVVEKFKSEDNVEKTEVRENDTEIEPTEQDPAEIPETDVPNDVLESVQDDTTALDNEVVDLADKDAQSDDGDVVEDESDDLSDTTAENHDLDAEDAEVKGVSGKDAANGGEAVETDDDDKERDSATDDEHKENEEDEDTVDTPDSFDMDELFGDGEQLDANQIASRLTEEIESLKEAGFEMPEIESAYADSVADYLNAQDGVSNEMIEQITESTVEAFGEYDSVGIFADVDASVDGDLAEKIDESFNDQLDWELGNIESDLDIDLGTTLDEVVDASDIDTDQMVNDVHEEVEARTEEILEDYDPVEHTVSDVESGANDVENVEPIDIDYAEIENPANLPENVSLDAPDAAIPDVAVDTVAEDVAADVVETVSSEEEIAEIIAELLL